MLIAVEQVRDKAVRIAAHLLEVSLRTTSRSRRDGLQRHGRRTDKT